MVDVIDKTKNLMAEVQRQRPDGTNQYLLIADFGNAINTSEKDEKFPFFRTFIPVKPESQRKLNSVYAKTLQEKFDYLNDSLMDYPTVIQYKLGYDGESWKKYNHLYSVHIARCPLNCWHCYLFECLKNDCLSCPNSDICDHNKKTNLQVKEDWFSAKQILDDFLKNIMPMQRTEFKIM